MIEMTAFLDRYMKALDGTFGERAWFVGLQGSYGRGEATETSDIDIVVILDELSAGDIPVYSSMLDTLPHREKICGFLSGREEILNWDAADLFQFYHDTKPVRGSLDALLPLLDDAAVERAIKVGACNIFHGCVHNMLYEKSGEILQSLYKSASFVVQAICFRQTGKYVSRRSELLETAAPEERAVLEAGLRLKNGEEADFAELSGLLFAWAQKRINKA